VLIDPATIRPELAIDPVSTDALLSTPDAVSCAVVKVPAVETDATVTDPTEDKPETPIDTPRALMAPEAVNAAEVTVPTDETVEAVTLPAT
jgi:hypothetical protein